MAGRQSRAQKLAPAFLMVATAIACGGVAEKERGEGPGETAGSGGVGSSPGTAGAGANPPYPGTAGAGANPPAIFCPETVPTSGSECSPFTNPDSCEYKGSPQQCGLPVVAMCKDGRWFVPVSSCNPPALIPCPSIEPFEGTSCQQGFSHYPELCNYPTPDCPDHAAQCVAGTWLTVSCDPGEGGSGGVPSYAGAPEITGGVGPETGGAAGSP